MGIFAADYLANLTADLTAKVLEAAGHKIGEKVLGTEEAQAVRRCIDAGVWVLMAHASGDEPESTELQGIFTAFFADPGVAHELKKLLRGRSWDRAELAELFAKAGYDAETLPGLKFEEGLDAFEAAFLAAAAGEPALQGVIQTGSMIEQLHVQQALLDEVRKIVAALPKMQAVRPEIRGGVIQDGHGNVIGDYSQSHVEVHEHYHYDKADDPLALRKRYLEELSRDANRLPWTVVERDYADPERSAVLGLSEVYTDLDTTELEKVTCEEDLRKFLACMEREETRRIPAQELVNRERRLLILGDPGSGKSTFLNHLAYTLAQAGLSDDPSKVLQRLSPWEKGPLLPLRIELRALAAWAEKKERPADATLILTYLHEMAATWELEKFWAILDEALRGKKETLLILFDGLDEVPSAQRARVVTAVQNFVEHYQRHRYVVTCRPYAYVGQPDHLQGFKEVTLAPFSAEQITAFVQGWYRQLARQGRLRDQEAETQAARLLQAVQQRDLHGLAQRPLLLTVMSWLHTFRGQLPEDRTELYADAVDLLLRRWEGRVGGEMGVVEQLAIPGLKMSDLEAGLYAVAFKAHSGAAEDEGTADIDEADLRKWLAPYLGNDWNKAGEFITYIRERAGLLVRHKHDAYTFPHRTFQEFMAACYLVGMDDYPSEAAKLVEQAPDRWREVFTLASGSAARTHRLGQAIAAVNALCPEEVSVTKAPSREAFLRAELAGTSLLEIGLVGVGREPVGRAALERMRRWLAAALRADHVLKPVERAEAGNVLAKLNDPRFRADAWFLPDEPLLGFVEIPQDAFRMGEGKEEHKLELPIYYIGRYPVTVAQFGAFVEAGGYREPHYWKEAQAAGIWQDGKVKGRLDDDPRVKPVEYGGSLESANHPVVGITWYEMVAYCRWLTEQLCAWQGTPEPLARLLRKEHWEVQLPSEAQWEKAARGTDGRVYPWVSDPDPNRANYDKTGIGATSAVGCFPGGRSPYDVEDLSGNVWEWTRSLYRGYPYDPKDGREVLDAGSDQSRVLRGGAFSNVRYVRCAWRNWDYPGSRSYDYGFRLVLSPYL